MFQVNVLSHCLAQKEKVMKDNFIMDHFDIDLWVGGFLSRAGTLHGFPSNRNKKSGLGRQIIRSKGESDRKTIEKHRCQQRLWLTIVTSSLGKQNR
jgi:hypothetical protein